MIGDLQTILTYKTSTKLANTVIKFEKFVGRTIKILGGKYQFLLKRVGIGIGVSGREIAEIVKKMSESEFGEFLGKINNQSKKIFLERYKKLMKSCPVCKVIFPESQLQHEFKHAKDFGIVGNWNKQNGQSFQKNLENHIAKSNIKKISGTYKKQSANFYYDPITNLTVFTYPNGEFWGAWKFSKGQYEALLSGKNVN